ncbi:major capsid protein [Microvirus D_HF38_35]|nr:major capsid protein [Microvirus D_HF38_35]
MSTFNLDSVAGFDTGSNYRFGDKQTVARPPRSLFDLTHQNTMTLPPHADGLLVPICVQPTVPGDSFDITVNNLIRVLPQVVPLYSRKRLYVHAFYSPCHTLYKRWRTFVTGGRTGMDNVSLPVLSQANIKHYQSPIDSFGLLHYLYDLPIGFDPSKTKVSALPAMMYQRVVRDYYTNRNLYLKDTWSYLFPDDDADYILRDDGSPFFDKTVSELAIPDQDYASWYFDSWHYRDYPADYFTSALPFLQRGDAPTADVSINGNFNVGAFDKVSGKFYQLGVSVQNQLASLPNDKHTGGVAWFDPADNNKPLAAYLNVDGAAISATDNYLGSDRSKIVHPSWSVGGAPIHNLAAPLVASGGTLSSSLTLASLRGLVIAQSILERLARTDGTYGSSIVSLFGVKPRTVDSYKPYYIGGTYTSITFGEVVQTSQSTVDSQLGQYAGHGFGVNNNGYIGHIDCDDYGYIMLIASVVPDVYYSQGVRSDFTALTSAELYMPDRAGFGLQPILNRELYCDGSSADMDLFAYQDAFDNMRYRSNTIHGQMADKSKLSFYPYTQSRYFAARPVFNQKFVSMKDNVRDDYLAAPQESAYTISFDIGLRAVRPLPYRAVASLTT